MRYLTSDLYIICHEFGKTPWNGIIFDSKQDAEESMSNDTHKELLKIMTLNQFLRRKLEK